MSRKLSSIVVGLSLLASPLFVSAQTITSSNTSLFDLLSQIVQTLEKEVQLLSQGSRGTVSNVAAVNSAMPYTAVAPISMAVDGELQDTVPQLQQRFALFKQMGVNTLMFDFGWNQLQTTASDTNYTIPSNLLLFMQTARDAGFKFELTLGSEDSPPQWFFAQHPDAKIIDQQGDYSPNMVSYWYAGIDQLMQQVTDYDLKTLAQNGLLNNVTYIRIPFGPAGEALYPAPWTMRGYSNADLTFWFYGANAQADFVAKMQTKYNTIGAANTAWGTSFTDWSKVAIPAVGTRQGQMWSDVLTWYKDTKDSFVAKQIVNYQSELQKYVPSNPPKLILLGGAVHITSTEWSQAIANGGGDFFIKIMNDDDFLVNQAAKYNLILQPDGMPQDIDNLWLQKYMHDNNITVPVFGEDAGGDDTSLNLNDYLYEIEQFTSGGFNYVNSNHILNADGTPNSHFALVSNLLQCASAELNGFKPSQGVNCTPIPLNQVSSSPTLGHFTLQAGQSISYGNLGLYMQNPGNLVLYNYFGTGDQTPLWASGTDGLKNIDCLSACSAVFQVDGNFVLYKQTSATSTIAYWSTGTVGNPNAQVKLSDSDPYVSIVNGSTQVWPTPPLSLTAAATSIPFNTSTKIVWSTSGQSSCTLTGPGISSTALSGSQSTGNLISNATYTLACTGNGGSKSMNVTVYVMSLPLPVSRVVFITDLYACILGRQPDPAGLANWVARPATSTIPWIYQTFFGSAEYMQDATSDQLFVNQLYQCVLFRQPDSGGYNSAIGNLQKGATRTSVLNSFLTSNEFMTSQEPSLSKATGFAL